MEVIKNQVWTYLSDRPVLNDLLWEGQTIRYEIGEMAERMVSPLLRRTSSLDLTSPDQTSLLDLTSSSITFAIYGRWGMGKSSALRMLEEKAGEIAKSHKVQDRLDFCKYLAPSYEALSQSYDARTTLALSILKTLAGGPKEAIDKFLGDAVAIGKLNEVLLPGADDFDERKATQTLSRMAVALSSLVDYDKIIEKQLINDEGLNRVLVVMIDDLDRCDTDFIWQVLNSIQQLSDIQNLFFVLAVDQNLLRDTVKERYKKTEGAKDPEFALEKYIQHSVAVPDLNEDGLKTFVLKLLSGYKDDDYVANAIIENIIFLQKGLKVLTPRSTKRCLNTIRPDLKLRLHENSTYEERQRVVKERMLEYVWSEFYHKYFQPAQHAGNRQIRLAFTAFESACVQYALDQYELDMEQIRFNFKRITARFGVNLEAYEDDEKLVTYLAIPPYWFARGGSDGRTGTISEILLGVAPIEPNSENVSNSLASTVRAAEEDADSESLFLKLYFQAEAAEANKDFNHLLEYLLAFYKLLTEHPDDFSSRHASTVGNMAINAGTINATNLAVRLYELALELDPEHSNNMQNFANYIIRNRLSNYYDKAQAYILKLKTGKHATHNIERTLALEAQIHELNKKEPTEIDEQSFQEVIQNFLNHPDNESIFTSVLSLLAVIKDGQLIHMVCSAFYNAVDNDEQRYLAIRSAADSLAAFEGNEEKDAMDIYRHLLTYKRDIIDEGDLADVLHNYAALLYTHDYDEEASILWSQAYGLKPKDPTIQKAYGMLLLHTGHPELAAVVVEGKPVDPPPFEGEKKVLPELFSDGTTDRWWER